MMCRLLTKERNFGSTTCLFASLVVIETQSSAGGVVFWSENKRVKAAHAS